MPVELPALAISGASVLTPLGDALEPLGARLREGGRAIPVELAPRAEVNISDFDSARSAAECVSAA